MIDPFEIALAFQTNEYTWKIDGKNVTPTEEDITQVIDHAIKVLLDSGRDRIELPIWTNTSKSLTSR